MLCSSFISVYPWDYPRYNSSFQWISRPWTVSSEFSDWWVSLSFHLNYIFAFVLAFNKVNNELLKVKYKRVFLRILILSLQHVLLPPPNTVLSHQTKLIEANWKQNLLSLLLHHIIYSLLTWVVSMILGPCS